MSDRIDPMLVRRQELSLRNFDEHRHLCHKEIPKYGMVGTFKVFLAWPHLACGGKLGEVRDAFIQNGTLFTMIDGKPVVSPPDAYLRDRESETKWTLGYGGLVNET